MKKYLLFYISIFVCSMVVLSSCYEDKGNYEYHELEEVGIDTTGLDIQAEYAIMRYDTLRIAPNIYFEGELVTDPEMAPLDYMWTIFSATTGVGANTVIDTIGYKMKLDTVITRKGGAYCVQLAVTNRHDGIRRFFRTTVSVSETFDGGWMVFYERADKPGYSDLALIHNGWVKANCRTNRIYENLYSKNNNGEYLPGSPIRCLDIAVSLVSGNNYIGLCTDQTLVGVSENGFERALAFSDFFYQQPETEAPVWYGQHGSGVMSGQNSEICINGNSIYTNTYSFSADEGRTTKFGMPKRTEGDDAVGELAPWNAEVAHTLNYGVVVYDQTNQRFRYAAYNSSKLEHFGPQDETKYGADLINNTEMTMLMSDWGKGTSFSAPYDYSIMKKGSNKYYLIVTNFSSSTPLDSSICVGRYEMIPTKCRGINKATTMAASNVGSFIYYGSGNKVYSYAYEGDKSTQVWAAKNTKEEVTCVRIMKYYHGTVYGYGMVPSYDNLVHIATWNEETQEGHLYQYKIDPASGKLDTKKSYDYPIPGKVKDMAWKFSMQ